MNWTGGKLSRVPKGAGKDVIQRQKAHFAKARNRRISTTNESVLEEVTRPYAESFGDNQEVALQKPTLHVAETESNLLSQAEEVARCHTRRHSRRPYDREEDHYSTQQDLSEHLNAAPTLEAKKHRLLHIPDWLGLNVAKSRKRSLRAIDEPSNRYAREVPLSSSEDGQPFSGEQLDPGSDIARLGLLSAHKDGFKRHRYARALRKELASPPSPDVEQKRNSEHAVATRAMGTVPSQRLLSRRDRTCVLSDWRSSSPMSFDVSEISTSRQCNQGDALSILVDSGMNQNVNPNTPMQANADPGSSRASKLGRRLEAQIFPLPSIEQGAFRMASSGHYNQSTKMPDVSKATSLDLPRMNLARETPANPETVSTHGLPGLAEHFDHDEVEKVDTSEDLWRRFIFDSQPRDKERPL